MISEIAISYIDTPFAHLGRIPGVSLDCVGCLVCSAKQAGYALEDFTVYGRDSDSVSLRKRLERDFTIVPIDSIQKDDVLLFWLINRSIPQHLGIYDGYGNFIHAYSRHSQDQSKVTSQALYPHWIKKVASAHRIKPELYRGAA